MLKLDGSTGEGGGQVLRTAMTLAACTRRPIRITDIRAGRDNPGLAAQHLTAARAVAALCEGCLTGDEIGSRELAFEPCSEGRAGSYEFDVGAVRRGGSAGSATLVLQSVFPVLSVAGGASEVLVRGGTHVPWSPPFEYLRDVWLPTIAGAGFRAEIALRRSGWYPAGGGEILARLGGSVPRPIRLVDRGQLRSVSGNAVAANLPAHVCRRMANRARSRLLEDGIEARIASRTLPATSAGAGIFLVAECAGARAGFSALGARGLPAERVADRAVESLRSYLRSGAAVDRHLGDQLLVPLALAPGRSELTVERITAHLTTNARIIESFGFAEVRVREHRDGGRVSIRPRE